MRTRRAMRKAARERGSLDDDSVVLIVDMMMMMLLKCSDDDVVVVVVEMPDGVVAMYTCSLLMLLFVRLLSFGKETKL